MLFHIYYLVYVKLHITHATLKYLGSGDFYLFEFSRISDFGTFHKNWNSQIFIFVLVALL